MDRELDFLQERVKSRDLIVIQFNAARWRILAELVLVRDVGKFLDKTQALMRLFW
jgi:hypothetical protein